MRDVRQFLRDARWRSGEGRVDVDGDALILTPPASGLGLFEWAGETPFDRYRFTAEARPLDTPAGLQGLYVARGFSPDAEHWFAALTFSEQVVLPPDRAQASFELYRYRPGSPQDAFRDTMPLPPTQMGQLFVSDPRLSTWRRLAIEATADTLQAYWGKNQFTEAVVRGSVRLAADMLAVLDPAVDSPGAPDPLAGFGFFCLDGPVAFRNISIEELLS
jgi:hypothetical protein